MDRRGSDRWSGLTPTTRRDDHSSVPLTRFESNKKCTFCHPTVHHCSCRSRCYRCFRQPFDASHLPRVSSFNSNWWNTRLSASTYFACSDINYYPRPGHVRYIRLINSWPRFPSIFFNFIKNFSSYALKKVRGSAVKIYLIFFPADCE